MTHRLTIAIRRGARRREAPGWPSAGLFGVIARLLCSCLGVLAGLARFVGFVVGVAGSECRGLFVAGVALCFGVELIGVGVRAAA